MKLWPFSRRSRAVPAGTPANPSSDFSALLGSQPTASGATVTPDGALAVTAVLACVRVLSESVASLPCIVYRRLENGKERAPKHPAYAVLHQLANPEITAFDFFEAMQSSILLRGNAYAYIERDRGARVKGLWPLRADQVRVERRADGWIWYVWTPERAAAVEFRRDEMLHVHGLSKDGLVGLSPIATAAEAVGVSLALQGFSASFFGQGTVMGGTLEHPATLSEVAAKRLKESVRSAHEGFSRAHKLLVLEEGMKYQRTGIAPEEAQFLESKKFQVEEIARIFRVPPHLIQSLERSTFSNIEHQGLDFVVHSLRPWLVRWEQAIARDVLREGERETYFAEFLVDGLLRGDVASRYQAYSVGRQWGWLSADDVRERENMNPLPGGKGKEYLSPLNMVPAGEDPKPSAPKSPEPVAPPDARSSAVPIDALRGVVEDSLARVLRREITDTERAVSKLEESRNREAFGEWREKFAADHGPFVERTLRPAIAALAAVGGGDEAQLLASAMRWHGETVAALADVQASDDARAVWSSAADRWRAVRVSEWTERLLVEAAHAR